MKTAAAHRSRPAKRRASSVKRFAGILPALLLGGCIASHRAVVTDVDSRAWSDTAQLTIPIDDTLHLSDLHFFLRYNDGFTADTLPVGVVVCSPDSLSVSERMTLRIRHSKGPASMAREADIPYRRRVRFSRKGEYRVLVVPDTTVRGIEAVGIHLTNSE